MSLIKKSKVINEDELDDSDLNDQDDLFPVLPGNEDSLAVKVVEAPKIEEEKQVEGIVEKVIFNNPTTGMTIYALKVALGQIVVQVTSTEVFERSTPVRALGDWGEFKGKRQFKASAIFEMMPSNLDGILLWMKKNKEKLPGIGEKTFKSLSKHFGPELINNMGDSEKLSEAISSVKAEMIAEAWKSRTEIMLLEMDLRNAGMKAGQIVKVMDHYKNNEQDILAIIKKNPWQLMEVEGVGFGTCDAIARKYEMDMTSPVRIRAGFDYVMDTLIRKTGDCGVNPDQLMENSMNILGISMSKIKVEFDDMLEKGLFCYSPENNLIFPDYLYHAEISIVQNIKRLIRTWTPISPDTVLEEIERAEKELSVKLDRDGGQLEAAFLALSAPICIITGGPGTGKSTTQNVIVRVLESRDKDVALSAFMGKAAKRLGEVTGREDAGTIHRLLHYIPNIGFDYNSEHRLDNDTVIVDEFSTPDVVLVSALFKALRDNSQIILVGDVDQLPSVGPGQVLRDLIESGVIPVARLTRIHRQVHGSQISIATNRINQGLFPIEKGEVLNGFQFIETPDFRIKDVMQKVIRDQIFNMGYDPIEDVQILMGYKVGHLGSKKINEHVKNILNPPMPDDNTVEINGFHYTLNDRVMQLKNDPTYKVFNGEVDAITGVHNSEKPMERNFIVDFEGKNVIFDTGNIDNITLAYAGTIHKSQGSEYPFVVIVVPSGHSNMLTKNLLYTAASRGKMDVILIGNKASIEKAISREDVPRKTGLQSLLRREIKPFPVIDIATYTKENAANRM